MHERPDGPNDDALVRPAANPDRLTSEAETRTPTPEEVEAFRRVIDDTSRRRPVRDFTSTDEFMRLIRDEI